MENKKIIFVPGWFHSLDFYKKKNGLEIWLDRDEFKKEISADVVLGHSLGASFSLMKYNDKIEKIFLFNPVIGKKSFWKLFSDWFKHAIFEKTEADKLSVILKFPTSLKNVSKLVNANYEKILQKIPAEKVVVYHGAGDKFLCDQICLDIFRKFGIKIIEIEEADHNWSEIFDQEVERIINSN